MELAYLLTGGAPIIKKYQVTSTVSTVGIPLLMPAAAGAGLALATTTSAADMVGVNLDTATYATAQQSDGSDPDAIVSVIINPDAVYRARLAGSGTSGANLVAKDVTTASTDGLAVTTGDDYSSPEMDEGIIWGYSGANAGIVRKITSTSTTAATVTVAFPRDTVVGDLFLNAPFYPMQTASVTLTATFDEIDASVALTGSAAAFKVVEAYLRDVTHDGLANSYALITSGDHVFGHRPT